MLKDKNMQLISPKIFGTLSLLLLIIVLPTIIFFTQKSTKEQQEATDTTCSGSGYFCSQTSCLDQHATFDTHKICSSVYQNNVSHDQFCCKRNVSPTP